MKYQTMLNSLIYKTKTKHQNPKKKNHERQTGFYLENWLTNEMLTFCTVERNVAENPFGQFKE